MSERYQAYPEYKNSGVEWLGNIPNHWQCLRLKYVSKLVNNKIEPDTSLNYVGMENVQSWNGKYISTEDIQPEGLSSSFSEGDVLFGKLRPYLAKSWLAEFSGICSSEFLVLKSFLTSPKFINYYTLTDEFIKQVDSSTYGSKMPRASWDFISLLGVPTPLYVESEIIANFLDHETAKIDNLIEKQQKLIQLLKEKRQAVISHAVTKGLNPDVPMRDSGVEWLGEVPEHWRIKRFKNLFKIEKRIARQLGFEVLSITQKGIKIKDTESGDGQLSMDYSKYQIVHKGDFAMNHMDLLTGFVDISKYKGVTSPDYRVFTLADENSIPEYYLYFLQMGYLNKLFFPFGQGAATIGRWRLPTEAFNEFLAPCPPEEEQKEIANFIYRSLVKISDIEGKAVKVIEFMQERRTALISAAVTGKIDVRNFQTPGV